MDTCFVTAKLTAKKGMEAQLEAEVVKNIPNVRAEKGCIRYDFHKNRSEDGTFLFYEIWESPEALDAHCQIKNAFVIHPIGGKMEYVSSLQDTLELVRVNNKWLIRKDIPQQNGKQSHD